MTKEEIMQVLAMSNTSEPAKKLVEYIETAQQHIKNISCIPAKNKMEANTLSNLKQNMKESIVLAAIYLSHQTELLDIDDLNALALED